MTADVPERPPHHDEKNPTAEVGAPEPLTVANESENSHSQVPGSKADGEAEEDEDGKAAGAPEGREEHGGVSSGVDVEMKDPPTDDRKPEQNVVKEETEGGGSAMGTGEKDEEMADVKDETPLEAEPEATQQEKTTPSGRENDASTADGTSLVTDGVADAKYIPPRTPPKTPTLAPNFQNEATAAEILAAAPQQDLTMDIGLSTFGIVHPEAVAGMQLGADYSAAGVGMVRSATYPLAGLDAIHHGIPGVDIHTDFSQLDFPAVPMPETPVHQINGNSGMNLSALQAFSPPNLPGDAADESRIIAYAMLKFDYGYDFYMKDYNLILGREDHSQQQHLQRQLELHDEHQNEFGPSATLSTQAHIGMDSLSPGLAALDTPLLNKKKKSKKSGGSSSHRSGSRKGKTSSSSHKTANGNTDTVQNPSNNQPEVVEDPYANELFLKIKHPDGRSLNNISRRHARIAYNFETRNFELQVLGKNGAFVNEHHFRTGTVAPLDNNTKVQIGRVVFHFLLPISDDEDDTAMVDPGNDNTNATGGKEKSHGRSNGEHRMSLSFHDEKGVELPPDSFDDDAVDSSSSSLTPVGSDDLESDEEIDGGGVGAIDEGGDEVEGGEEDAEGDEDEEVLEDEEHMMHGSEGGDHVGDGDDEGEDEHGGARGEGLGVARKRASKGTKGHKSGDKTTSALKHPKPRGRPPKEKMVKEKRPRGRRPEPEKAKQRELEKIAERESAMAKAREKEAQRERKEKEKEEERKERQKARFQAQEEKRLRKQKREEEKLAHQKEKEERKQRQALEREAKLRESKEAKMQQQEAKPPKPPKEKKKKKKRSPSPPINEADLPPEALLKPTVPYSVMIFDAIVNSESKKLSLPDLYRSIERSYPWFKLRAGTSGWQSSVRHNLRGCPDLFYTVQKEGKGYLWGVKDGANVDKERKKRRGISSPPPPPASVQHQDPGYQNVPAPAGYGGLPVNTAPLNPAGSHSLPMQHKAASSVPAAKARKMPTPLAPAPHAPPVAPQPYPVLTAGPVQYHNPGSVLANRPPASVHPQRPVPPNVATAIPTTAPGPAMPILPANAGKAPPGPSVAPQRNAAVPGTAGMALPASSIPQKRPANPATVQQTRPPAVRPGAVATPAAPKPQLDQKTIAALTTFKAALTAQLNSSANAAGGSRPSGSGAPPAAGSGGAAQMQTVLQTLGAATAGGTNTAVAKALFDAIKNASKSGAAAAAKPNTGSTPVAAQRPPAGKAPNPPGQAPAARPQAGPSSAATASRPQASQPRPSAAATSVQSNQLLQMLTGLLGQKKAGGVANAAQAQRQPAASAVGGNGPTVIKTAPRPASTMAESPGLMNESSKRQLEVESAIQPPAKRPAVQQQQ